MRANRFGSILVGITLCLFSYQSGSTARVPNNEILIYQPVLDHFQYLPMIYKGLPSPVLEYINNSDYDGSYTISWSAVGEATSYVLDEDSEPGFSTPNTIYTGSGLTTQVVDRSYGIYFYRVMAIGPTGCSAWSNVQSAIVLGN